MLEPSNWYDANATDNPPWIKALAEVSGLPGRLALPARPGHRRGNRPVCGSGIGQPRVLLEQALWDRWKFKRSHSVTAVLGAAGFAKQFWRSVMPNYRQSNGIPGIAVEAIKGLLTIPD
jgi:hypothetical protein